MKREPDRIDRRILHELQENGRLSIVELAQRVNLTKTPCAQRVRRLEREGFIKGYRAELDADRLGIGHIMVVMVTLSQTSDTALEDFNTAVRRIPEVQSCYLVAGDFDYLIKVRTSDIAHYRNVLGEQIGKLPCVQQTHSYVVMEQVKDDARLPVRRRGE
ncbi:MAG: Lrp/AsnC ligand binding domain-containing protein [Rhodobiaceae bacterium]|nr:Lrp/AsnC ligand binding domain-containing protein [Rhodobiaceae bacterium]MCC0017013.1 Lrp/AsnC ligand binding domain-containing protein [Rhodobiaceae bacterium]MCC0053734.1 Lrp/AsnC ligand binding domain-containing protein [Rhodobiaceae bacterium]